MRISDWVSDVCSSDLRARSLALKLHQRQRHVDRGMSTANDEHAFSGVIAPAPTDHIRTAIGYQVACLPQIGRASCRGRVCPYVQLSAGAVESKQKSLKRDSMNLPC